MSIFSKIAGKLIKPSRKGKPKPRIPTPPKEKSPATIAKEERGMAKRTRGTRALRGLQLEAQRKAKDAKRGVDKKKQAAVKKRIKSIPAVRERIRQNKQIEAIEEERAAKPVQNPQKKEGQAVTSRNKNPDAVFTSGDNKIVTGKRSKPYILDNMSVAQKNRAKRIVKLGGKVREDTATSAEKAMLKKLNRVNMEDYYRALRAQSDTKAKPGRKARLEDALKRKTGGPTNPISTQGSYGGKKKVVAKADWMQGLTPNQIKQILGGPTTDSSGVTRHSKRKTTGKKKVVKAKAGGKVIKTNMSGDDLVRRNYD
tara:strand:+ start:78 stop:1013 length:936 start_codon:yes stop_codon:yes gene_type:complete